MDEVFQFVATFKEFPPRSFPPSFNPANILEEHDGRHQGQQAEGGERAKSIDRIRGSLNQMIEQQLQQRGVK